MTSFSFHAARWFAIGSLWCTTVAWASEGHDHGDAQAAAAGNALPRFTAVSETFEMVGVLDGQQLTLYLDRYADNSPVQDAQIGLEIGGVKVPVQAHEQDVYEATLTEALKPGVTPVTATVIAGANTDRLAGEFDLHEEAHDDAASEHPWQPTAAWLVGAMLAIVLLVWSVRRVRIAPSARSGGAA